MQTEKGSAPTGGSSPQTANSSGAPATPQPANTSGPSAPPPARSATPSNGINFSNSNDDSIHTTFYNAANNAAQQGQNIQQEAGQNVDYFGNLMNTAQQQAQAYADPIGANPGFTPAEASQINVNYGQFNTPQSELNKQFLTSGEQQAIQGNTQAPVDVMNTALGNTGQELNAYQANLGNQAAQGQNWITQAAAGAPDVVSNAASNINAAITPEQQAMLSDADVNALATQAGVTEGNLYQAQRDAVRQAAAAAGNTSPLAIAAAENRLINEQGGAVGNAMANARLGAQQQKFSQQQGLTAQQIAAQTALGQQGLSAAGLQENAAQAAANQGLTAAELAGQAGLQEQEFAAQQGYGAANTAEQANAARAAQLAADRQATQQNVSNTAYGQGVGSAQATAQGAEATGNARMNQQQQYLNFLTGEQLAGQQGQANSIAQQIAGMGTEGQLVNQDVNNRATYASQNQGFGATLANSFAGSLGNSFGRLLSGPSQSAQGGIYDKPTDAIVGERGPEAIIKLGADGDDSNGDLPSLMRTHHELPALPRPGKHLLRQRMTYGKHFYGSRKANPFGNYRREVA
jgi:hypothetical protein